MAAAALASAIGSRIRRERQVRRWTLDQLATAAGVSRRMVVSVEQGDVNPSIGTLLRLSDALGIGLPSLVQPVESKAVQVTPAGRGAVLWTGEFGGQGVLVAGTTPPDVLELWDWTLGPGDEHESETHAAGTRELLHLHTGAISLVIDHEPVSLKAGDAISFLSDVPHSYRNPGRKPARFSLAVFEPGVGREPRPSSP